MPLYEFQCNDCGLFEEWRVMAKSDNAAFCPHCNNHAKRIFSPPNLISLSNSLPSDKTHSEPKLVKQNKELKPPRFKNHSGSRPWMINH